MSEAQSLLLTEQTYRLIADTQQAFDLARRHRDAILRATFAAAGIGEATVLRMGEVGDRQGLYYTMPSGVPVKPPGDTPRCREMAGGGGVKGALIGGLEGGAGAAVLGGKGIGALNKAKNLIGAAPGVAGTDTAGGGGFLSNLVAGIAKDPLKAAQYGLAGYSALQGAKAQSRGNAALGTALGSLGQGEPLQREDLSSVYDTGNPYA